MTSLTVLGCGGSLGTPSLRGSWGVCDPANPKNRRLRSGAWVEHDGKKFLLDTSPDLRQQIQAFVPGAPRPDAVLYTHVHADHCHGIDELRNYWIMDKQLVPIYARPAHLAELIHRFGYQFEGAGDLYRPVLSGHALDTGRVFFADTEVTVFDMPHGGTTSTGYRMGDIAWTTDFKTIGDDGLAAMAGIKVWFAAVAFMDEIHPSHASLPEVLDLYERLGQPQTYLIHLNSQMDYAALDAATPANMSPAHDGMMVTA
jgi:phosphoribosyl 1,2-cyclic phosphate phosphodiesterase